MRRRIEARDHLRAALEGFESLRASLWAERARLELRASGETARQRDPSTRDDLTPQELQIARLVGEGLSSREIATQLFLSPRTVDFHLRNIFRELGLSSRSQLVRLELGATVRYRRQTRRFRRCERRTSSIPSALPGRPLGLGRNRDPDREEETMKVFVAGASGAIGRRLVPLLVAGGHEVTGMTHRVEHARVVADLGARPVVADGLDPDAVRTAVLGSEPEVVIHQMTSLAGITSFKRLDRELAQTNRLRTAGTDNLLESARLAGARRLVAQSFGLLRFAPAWRPMVAENDVPSGNAPEISWETHRAVRHVESTVPRDDDLEGVVLRYGFLYGPGTGLAADGSLVDLIRRRQWPIIGDGAGTWSFVHVDDAAAAAVAALDGGSSGVYNVADDEPAPVAVWLPELAAVLGAKPPRRVPEWFGRLAAGEWAVYLSTGVRGLLNAKAKRGLAWQPFHPSWRRGFRDVLGEMPAELVASAAASG